MAAVKNTLFKEPEDDGYEDIYIPKERGGLDKFYASVNGERIMVRRGETVRVKHKFAEVIRRSLEQDEKTDELIEELSKH